jgi:hypothetical protein
LRAEVRRILGREDGDGDRRLHPAHGGAGLASEGFGDVEIGGWERGRN